MANAGSGALVDMTGRRVFLQTLSLLIGGASLLALGAADGIWLIISMLIFIGFTNNLWHPQPFHIYQISIRIIGVMFFRYIPLVQV